MPDSTRILKPRLTQTNGDGDSLEVRGFDLHNAPVVAAPLGAEQLVKNPEPTVAGFGVAMFILGAFSATVVALFWSRHFHA